MIPTLALPFIGSLGIWEAVLLLALAMLVFGRRLPDLARSLGKGVVEFKKGLAGVDDPTDAAALPQPPKQLAKQFARQLESHHTPS